MQLIIPMAGTSSRFREHGCQVPKFLIEIDGQPIIRHVIDLFPGVQDIVFICNKKDLQESNVRDVLGGICSSSKILEIDQHKKGPVYTVAQVFDHIDDDKEIIVTYCDYGTAWNFDKFLFDVRAGKFDGALACYRGFHPHMLGSDNYAFCREKDNILLEIREKASFTNDRMSEFASNGTYYFKSGALLKKYFQETIDLDINFGGEYYVSLVYNLLARDGLRSLIFEIDKMLQWGTPEDVTIYKGWSEYFRKRSLE